MDKINNIEIMTPICICCKREIKPEDGLFYALGHPYFGLIHYSCAARSFSYPPCWVHPNPRQFYFELALIKYFNR